MISVIHPDQELSTLRAYKITNKLTVLECLDLTYKTWNVLNKITMRYGFRYSRFILSPKEAEALVIRPTNLSAEIYNEWINIDEEVQTTEVITEKDICGNKIQSKRQKVNVADDNDKDEPDEKPSSTKHMLEAL